MIKPDSRRILDILNSDIRYEVPAYQRDYRWGEYESTELIGDLNDSADAGLFLGTIILNTAREREKLNTVVDGQQRLTTISLLLIACREVAKKLTATNMAEEIQRRLTLKDHIGRDIGCKIIVSESIRDAYDYIAKYDWNGIFPERNAQNRSIKRQVNRIRPVYNYFFSFIGLMDQEELVAFLDKIYNAHVIEIGIQDTNEAFSIFERTNARGVNLEASDLLKNTLFASKVEGISDQWKEIVENSNGNILRMLKYYYISHSGLITKSKLYRKIKDRIKDTSAEFVVNELDKFSEFYDAFVGKPEVEVRLYFENAGFEAISSSDPYLRRIYRSIEALRLFKITQIYPIIYSALQCMLRNKLGNDKATAEKFVVFIECLERYHFINNAIGDRIGNEVEKFYADYCFHEKAESPRNHFSGSDDFHATVKSFLSELRSKLIHKDQFIASFAEISFDPKTRPLIHYIFDRINAAELRPNEDQPQMFRPDPKIQRKFYNIEHFHPISKKSDLKVAEAVDSIGNLLSIGKELNSSLNDKTPAEKIQSLKGNNRARTARLPYLDKFIEEYEPLVDRWNHETIEQRSKALAKQGYEKVWAFKI